MQLLSPDEPLPGNVLSGTAIELKLAQDASAAGQIDGYAATFDGLDHGGDTIRPGAFADTIADHVKAKRAPPMLWMHRQAEPIGRWTAMGEDSRGLRVRGALNLATDAGRKAHEHLKAGDISGLSIGFIVPPGGQSWDKGKRILSKLNLAEVSVVSVPMDPFARVDEVKSLGTRGDLEDLLRRGGLPRGAARKVAAAGWPVLSDDDSEAFDLSPVTKRIGSALAELKALRSTR